MTASFALPFLTLPDEVVGFRDWLIGDPEEPLFHISRQLDAWDYARDLQLDTRLDLDLTAAAASLQIPANQLKLAVVVAIGSGTGRFARRMERVCTKVICAPLDAPLGIRFPVDSRNLSGRLLVRLEILLAEDVAPGADLSPRLAGSRLWSDTSNVHLEDGGDTRFPLEVLSFHRAFPGQRQETAPWYFHWRPGSMQADFTGSVRLYVNADHEALTQRVSEGDPVTLQAILGDVMVQMCRGVLEDDEAREAISDCEEGSVGSQVAGWLEMSFPGMKPDEIRGLMTATPGAFHAALHASADMGASE
ncbi:hypothetical protein JMM61_14115 [Rhodovulum sulfidophilum]|uniref:hypothetical protein n=1 Tax=Rhodovulum sulfidophilum TaxID=35806 RepID=UPI00192823F2|nr:hypothetical protein [Rhodovulum sulfidophilum]MBL3586513.1 hypothetical protein [Rhodovulum sulfidophilum]